MTEATLTANQLPLSLDLKLPWQENLQQEERFKAILKKVSIPLLIFFLSTPWLPIFESEMEPLKSTIVKTKVLLDPPIVEEKPKPIAEKPKPKPQQQVATSSKPAKETKSTKVADVNKSGIAGFAKQLSALRGSLDVAKLSKKNVNSSTTGKVQKSTRTVLSQDTALRASGGIKVDQVTIGNQGGSLVAHQSVSVDSPIKGIDLPGARSGSFDSNIEGRRDMESIRQVFERYKGSVYAIYTQTLRDFPELSGKFLFQLVIEPDGSITNLKLVTSELGMQSLEQRILARISTIRFAAESVAPTAVQYKFVFLPN